MPSDTAKKLLSLAENLRQKAGALTFPEELGYVYNPLDYAWDIHASYIQKYGNSPKKAIFLGINPGPFGMAQTGIPFGEIAAVRDFLKLEGPVGRPKKEHPKRPVDGFACKRSEVSGKRLWGLFKERFKTAEVFFKDHYVLNYCPLLFLEPTGRNFTPDKLPMDLLSPLLELCDAHLRAVAEILEAKWVVGLGGVVTKRCSHALAGLSTRYGQVLHPSPANPQANGGKWPTTATEQMRALGIWE